MITIILFLLSAPIQHNQGCYDRCMVEYNECKEDGYSDWVCKRELRRCQDKCDRRSR